MQERQENEKAKKQIHVDSIVKKRKQAEMVKKFELNHTTKKYILALKSEQQTKLDNINRIKKAHSQLSLKQRKIDGLASVESTLLNKL